MDEVREASVEIVVHFCVSIDIYNIRFE